MVDDPDKEASRFEGERAKGREREVGVDESKTDRPPEDEDVEDFIRGMRDDAHAWSSPPQASYRAKRLYGSTVYKSASHQC